MATSPRCNVRYHRHSKAARHGKSKQMNRFLSVEATRLSTTAANLFTTFAAKNRQARQILAASSFSASDVHGF